VLGERDTRGIGSILSLLTSKLGCYYVTNNFIYNKKKRRNHVEIKAI
jgi:hypothetical protein